MNNYMESAEYQGDRNLVRFHYHNKEDMFDAVSYQKGGRILHMLRNFVGDSAFFKSLNLYLSTNKFKSAEAHQLRLAFEEVTGRDLNWFFNQWYFGSGHPSVDISYDYDDAAGKVKVTVKQLQTEKIFTLPIAIDVYEGGKKTRHNVWIRNPVEIFSFDYKTRPTLVNVDADKVMLWMKKDNKNLDNYVRQYHEAGNFVDRLEAVEFAADNLDDPKAVELLKAALKDKYHTIRSMAIGGLNLGKETLRNMAEPILLDLSKNDGNRLVKAAAISKLGDLRKKEYADLFKAATKDSSYTVAGQALTALGKVDKAAATEIAKGLANTETRGLLNQAVMTEIVKSGDESMADKIIGSFEKMPLSDGKFQFANVLSTYLANVKNIDIVKRGVDAIVGLRNAVPEAFRDRTDPYINGMILKGLLASKQKESINNPSDEKVKEVIEYIKEKLPESEKKGF
jgi:aminopeptidase N